MRLDRTALATLATHPRTSRVPNPAAKGDETAEPLFAAVGRALSNWEHTENQLANLFTVLVGAKVTRDRPSPAVRAYGTVVSFKGRIAMLEGAAKAYFLSHPDLGHSGQWSELGKQLEGFAERRNDIAHGSVELLFDLGVERHLGFFLMPGLYVSKKYPTDEPPKYQLVAEQVMVFAQCFSDLADSVRYFRFVLQTKRRSSPRKPPAPSSGPQFRTHSRIDSSSTSILGISRTLVLF
jgi:hypothetical protein